MVQDYINFVKNSKMIKTFKFFKGEALLEFGYNKTDWEAHFMYRF